MKDQLPKFDPVTLLDTLNATSLPESAAGPMPCAEPAGQTADLFGLVPVPANRTARRAKVKVIKTPATYGLTGSGLSASAALSQYLANRLQQRFDTVGSILFKQTWRVLTTPSGRQLWAHTASVRRTSDSAFTSWPTPCTPSGGRSVSTEKMDATGRTTDGRKHASSLDHAAKFALWPTPMAGTPAQNGNNEAGNNNDSSRKTVSLIANWPTPKVTDGDKGGGSSKNGQDLVTTASWATPAARDYRSDRGQKTDAEQYGTKGRPLPSMPGAAMAGWLSPTACSPNSLRGSGQHPDKRREGGHAVNLQDQVLLADSGTIASGSCAPTEKRGQLNPDHSRWLMGYPAVWGSCGAMAMQLIRKLRRRS